MPVYAEPAKKGSPFPSQSEKHTFYPLQLQVRAPLKKALLHAFLLTRIIRAILKKVIGESSNTHHNSPMSASAPLSTPRILLSTLNAKYIHASLGLRYLLANMGDLRDQTILLEFTIARPPEAIVTDLLAALPEEIENGSEEYTGHASSIIGFGVYIWNVQQTTAVLRLLREKCPKIKIVLGGPEVSHETGSQEITQLADYVITGWGDISFARLCRDLIAGRKPLNRIITGEQGSLDQLNFPYTEYSDADLSHRLLYVEASRGCPFKCEFCLSALDKTAWPFNLEKFLAQMQHLYERGARHFKFVDRTFNLKIDTSIHILEFFLARLEKDRGALFVHFELVPDHLPERLRAVIARFPPGVLQFEVGIQSFNSDVQTRISRKQDNDKTEANLRWLIETTYAHIHADLIFGLPGETLDSFADSFNRLYAIGPHEIQLGILKRLRGTPIIRHTDEYGMVYDTNPPYTVRQTSVISHSTMQAFHRFSRYWDYVANSGRFPSTLKLLLASTSQEDNNLTKPESPFHRFWTFSEWLWNTQQKTHGLSPEQIVDSLWEYLHKHCALNQDEVKQTLLTDYIASGARSNPSALQGLLPRRTKTKLPDKQVAGQISNDLPQTRRQGRHSTSARRG